jgi:hypothetical protein
MADLLILKMWIFKSKHSFDYSECPSRNSKSCGISISLPWLPPEFEQEVTRAFPATNDPVVSSEQSLMNSLRLIFFGMCFPLKEIF